MTNIVVGPYWELASEKVLLSAHNENATVLLKDSHCLVTSSCSEHRPTILTTKGRKLLVFGTPIYQGRLLVECSDQEIFEVVENDTEHWIPVSCSC